MPLKFVLSRLAAACALALVLCASFAAAAVAKGPVGDMRVIGSGGKVIAEGAYAAATATVKASPKANCFGPGTGGSGKSVTVKGPTALGMLILAAQRTGALKPLLITDAFDFGLGLCGIGGATANLKLSWYLKVNHKNPELGGEMVKVKAGDDVLWALAAFPYPDELELSAPDRAQAGMSFTVRVFSYDDKGKKTPAVGATVTGGTAPTGKDGRTTVVLNKATPLIARHGKDIPSNREAVCVGGKCPRG